MKVSITAKNHSLSTYTNSKGRGNNSGRKQRKKGGVKEKNSTQGGGTKTDVLDENYRPPAIVLYPEHLNIYISKRERAPRDKKERLPVKKKRP